MGAAEYIGCIELNTEKVSLPKCNSSQMYNCTDELRYNKIMHIMLGKY